MMAGLLLAHLVRLQTETVLTTDILGRLPSEWIPAMIDVPPVRQRAQSKEDLGLRDLHEDVSPVRRLFDLLF